MTSAFHHLKRGSCPICNGIRKDCRRSTRTGLIHCRANDVTSVPGWRFIKQDAQGFNLWAINDGRDRSWPSERLEQWKRQQKARREQQEIENSRRRARLLSLEERDRHYRSLNQQLVLSYRHRQILHGRGLTDVEIDLAIELGAVRTWNPGQRVTGRSPALAGVSPVGTRQLIGSDGFVIAAFDPDGQITGYQRKTDKGEPKYNWVTSEWRGGNGPHLPNGELPLFAWKHPQAPGITEVWLCEGALKSMLVAFQLWRQGRTDIAVIGTASSARYGEQTLKAYLQQIGAQTVRLMPDAGAVVNPAIHKANQQTLKWCQQWGYPSVTVGWWGQVDKFQPDIDELPDFSRISYLDPGDFLALAERAQYQQRVKEVNAKLNALTHPALEVNQRYLDVIFPNNGIQFIRSPMGTGKTESIKRLREECQQKETRLLLLGSRNGLLYQTCQRAGIEHLHSLQVTQEWRLTGLALGHAESLAMCIDSIWRLQASDWTGATVIIDEAESVVEHLLVGSTCVKRRAILCTKLAELIQTVIGSSGRVILMDAHLSDIPLDYIKLLAPPETVVAGLINCWKPQHCWNVQFHHGTTNGIKDYINDNSAVLRAIFDCLESGGVPVIPTDSQLGAEALERQLIEAGYPGGLRVDGETSEINPQVKGFLENPNQWLRLNCPRWLIYTPTAESGLSIDETYFTDMFALFQGVLTTKTQLQMLGRVRTPIPRHIFTVAYGLKDEDCSRQLPEEIEARLLQYHASNNLAIELAGYLSQSEEPTDIERLAALNRLIDPLSGKWDNPHLTTWAKLKARSNYALANLRDELRAALVAAGHRVVDIRDRRAKELKDELTNMKDEIKLERATARANAKDISIAQARVILQSDSSTVEERNQAYKALLADAVPGVPLTPEFILKAQIENKGQWLRVIRLDWMLKHPEVQIKLDRQAWSWQLEQPFVSAQDIRAYTLKLKALKALGIEELLEPERVYTAHCPETQAYIERVKSKRAHLRTLGMTLSRKDHPISFIKRLLRKIGAELECFDRVRDGNGKKAKWIRLYRVKHDYWSDPDRLAVLEAFERKYASLRETEAETVTTQAQPALESRQFPQNKEYKNGESWQAYSESSGASVPKPQATRWPVEILTRLGQWLKGYFYVGRKGDRYQLCDLSGFDGIWVDEKEFRFAEG